VFACCYWWWGWLRCFSRHFVWWTGGSEPFSLHAWCDHALVRLHVFSSSSKSKLRSSKERRRRAKSSIALPLTVDSQAAGEEGLLTSIASPTLRRRKHLLEDESLSAKPRSRSSSHSAHPQATSISVVVVGACSALGQNLAVVYSRRYHSALTLALLDRDRSELSALKRRCNQASGGKSFVHRVVTDFHNQVGSLSGVGVGFTVYAHVCTTCSHVVRTGATWSGFALVAEFLLSSLCLILLLLCCVCVHPRNPSRTPCK
jgi:hypothetical protein